MTPPEASERRRPGERTLVDLVGAVAADCPDATAVVAGEDRLSYADLDMWSRAVAAGLRRRGIGPGAVVGILTTRGPELVPAILGVLRAGAAFLPLDPDFPGPQLRRYVADSGCGLILTDERCHPEGAALGPAWCVAEAESPASEAAVTVRADDLAYVLFTSGSTGRPKGVEVEHGALANFLTGIGERLGSSSTDIVLAHTSVSFDIFLLELLLPLTVGGTVLLASRELTRTPRRLTELLRTATVAQATPSMWALLLDTGWTPHAELTVLSGGEALTPDTARRLHATSRALWNLYGPTEATIWTSCHRVRSVGSFLPLGEPLPNTDLHVLDAELRPHTTGELYLSGLGLARGYAHRPDLTAEAFQCHPGSGVRLYRTGDLVRRHSDGQIEWLGRTDQQIKVQGIRVEPQEVAAALERNASVLHAVVVLREERPGDARLVGYVVPAAVDVVEVRARLREELPHYLVPAAIVAVDALPMMASGKLDRAALPAPDYGAGSSGGAPGSAQERALCELFAEVLGVPEVGTGDGFFDLGGHSMLAMRLVTRIRSAFGVELGVREVFEAQTVAALSSVIGGLRRDPRTPLTATGRRTAPLTYAQQGLWFLAQLDEPSAAYHMPLVLKFPSAVDADVLTAALRDLVTRHEILRTVYPDREGMPCQQVLDPDEAAPRLNRRSCEANELEQVIGEVVDVPMDLSSAPPVAAWLVAAGSDQVLVLVVHHIATDGWSKGPLLRDLFAAFAARSAGAAPQWPDLCLQYVDYSVWQRAMLGENSDSQSVLARQFGYWQRQLTGAPACLPLRTDHPRPEVATRRSATVELVLGAGPRSRLLDLARSRQCTMFMVLQAAVAVLLVSEGAPDDIPIGTPVAGRNDKALEELVGFFANTIVLRNDLSGDPTFAELLTRVRETALDAYANQDLPFELLVELLNPERSFAHHPLFQVMVAVNQEDVGAGDASAPAVELTARMPRSTEFDLAVTFEDVPGVTGKELLAVLEYATDLFGYATARTLADRLHRLLAEVADDPLMRVSDLVDRSATAEGSATPSEPAGVTAAPAHSVQEQVLCELFAEVLGVPVVHAGDNFFDLGGHSMLAMRLIGRIRPVLGVRIAVRELFQSPTAAELNQCINATDNR